MQLSSIRTLAVRRSTNTVTLKSVLSPGVRSAKAGSTCSQRLKGTVSSSLDVKRRKASLQCIKTSNKEISAPEDTTGEARKKCPKGEEYTETILTAVLLGQSAFTKTRVPYVRVRTNEMEIGVLARGQKAAAHQRLQAAEGP